MRIETGRFYAVLSGDVTRSSRLETTRRRLLQEAMESASAELLNAFPDALPQPIDFFRGDSWQAVVAVPAKALRISLFFRATLKASLESHSIDSRVSIAVGPLAFVPENRVSHGEGQAFQLSGRGLDRLPGHVRMKLTAPPGIRIQSLDLVVELVDQIAARWTDRQSRAVMGALRGWKQERIGESWPLQPVSQQTVQEHLDRASWHSIDRAIRYFEEWIAVLTDRRDAADSRLG